MYMIKYLIAITVIIAYAHAENVGWQKYFTENPTEFHDLPLKWENGNQTNVPSWLSGVYVRNGPAQVYNFHFYHKNFKCYLNRISPQM